MDRKNIIAGIDLGSSYVRVIIGRLNTMGAVEVLGFSEESCDVIKNGVIIDIDRAIDVLERNIIAAEDQAHFEIKHVLVHIGGQHVQSKSLTSRLEINHYDHKIRNYDLYHVVYESSRDSVPQSYEILYTDIKDFSVDGVNGVQTPLHMVANELAAEMQVFYGRHNLLQNISSVFQSLGLRVETMYPSALLSSEAILAYEEKDLGVVCLDIGAQTIDMIAYKKGHVVWSATLPIGSDQITEQLSEQLCISWEQAEDLKKKYGYVGPLGLGEDREILLQNIARDSFSRVKSDQFNQVIEDGVHQMLENVRLTLQSRAQMASFPAGVVVTGGMAHLKGAAKLIEQDLGCTVRMGSVDAAYVNEECSLKGYAYSLCCGMVKKGIQDRAESMIKMPGRIERAKHMVGSFFLDLF